MPSTIKQRKKPQSGRVTNDKGTPVMITSMTKSGSTLTIVFQSAVMLTGTPKYTTDLPTVTVVSAVQTAPNIVAITYSGPITTATKVNIPFEDPAIRGVNRGYVYPSTFPPAA